MAAVTRARPGGSFATRLAVAVLLAASLSSALVTVLANRLAEGAVRRETVHRVVAAASAVTGQLTASGQSPGTGTTGPAEGATGPAEGATGPAEGATDVPTTAGAPASTSPTDAVLTRTLTAYLTGLAAEPDVLGLLVVDERGTVLLGLAGAHASGSAPEASPADRTALADVASRGTSTTTTGRRGAGPQVLTVRVPLQLPGRAAALQVRLDSGPMAERADQLWRALGVSLMLGTAATVGLTFLAGGRGLVRRQERALLAARSDDLTGLGSRRAFRCDLRTQVEHAAVHGLPLTLALIDINGLERVNGTVGRRRGDALLVSVGSVLQRAAELVDRPVPAYRIGGDAFALIMPGAGQDEAFHLTDTLRRHIGLDAAPLTANVGLSVLDTLRCPDPETLLIAADAALFEARSLGGNRVVGAGDGGTGLRWVATSGAHDRLGP